MLTKEELEHLAKLAKIEFKEKELEKILEDIEKIFGYVNEIHKLDLENYEPMIGGPIQTLGLREDIKEVCDLEIKELIINQFPEKEKNFLKVPKIIEK
ncbi:MAG: Asp-tRNA(Asn)/Glu-tRNA(Gln) amidotransferase subunit GatC [Candidatus Aenigmatarchaeota archaeon]